MIYEQKDSRHCILGKFGLISWADRREASLLRRAREILIQPFKVEL